MDDGYVKPKESSVEHNTPGPTYKYYAEWNEDTNCVNHFMIHKQCDVFLDLDFVLHNFYKYSYVPEETWLRLYKNWWDMME